MVDWIPGETGAFTSVTIYPGGAKRFNKLYWDSWANKWTVEQHLTAELNRPMHWATFKGRKHDSDGAIQETKKIVWLDP